MFDLILFDLDGTLVDTAGEIADTANDVLQVLRLQTVPEALARSWIGQGSRELMIRACAHAAGMDEAKIRASSTLDSVMLLFTRFHQQRCGTRSQVYPRVKESLAALAAQGIGLAVVTNREARFAEAVLRTHGLRDFFDPVVCGDSLSTRKPDAAPVRYCLDMYRVAPQRALLVGDSAVDVATGRNAGIACWAVPYGYNGGRGIAEENPDRVIADLSEVVAAVGGSQLPPQAAPTQNRKPLLT